MKNKNFKIVVSGDICINALQWITYPKSTNGLNWQTHLNIHNTLRPGEALLLSKLVTLATEASVFSPYIRDIEGSWQREFLSSTAELDIFPKFDDKNNKSNVYRIKRLMGFTESMSGIPRLLPIMNDDPNTDMIILDDENNGFNFSKDFWPLALKSTETSPIVLYKMNNPIDTSELWKHLQKFHNEKTIVIINGDDLRSKGVNISKSLSWERTAQDFVWQINNNPNLAFLASCRHLIIPFGLEGAIYYRNESTSETRLYFLPYGFEGSFIKDTQGKMIGLTSCFVAGLASAIVTGSQDNEELYESIGNGIRQGIVSAQKYFIEGFGENIEQDLFPKPSIFNEKEEDFIHKDHVQDVLVPVSVNSNCRSCWYILKDKSSTNLAEIAYDIVKNGVTSALKSIPIAQFGNLKTVDKAEIESYRSIKNLMMEYISTKNTVRPLSIAVFGTPGSGKSFGIVEVANSIASNLIKKLDFNLSQFSSPLDLVNSFHKVRDIVLEGKIPLVFFDEFDSALEGKLGWLKYFLAPMQDGAFREGDSIHPIGKAIFVFAGGTSSTFKEFCGENLKDETEKKKFLLDFKGAKGPDFISRLRGYVNILGPNQTDEKWDHLFIIRRAMLLRSLLERKASHLMNEAGEAQIDNGVLRALLKIKRYKHESRSMEAILEMSMLNNAKKWEQSYLPSKEQLKLHVDEEQFLRHLMHDAFYSEKIESLAMAIYEHNKSIEDLNCIMTWQELSEEFKNSIRNQAKNIPNALLKINYDVVAVKESEVFMEFTAKELEILAKDEHKSWYNYRKKVGWKYGEVKDNTKKIDPELVAWNNLTNNKKNKIYEMVKAWPEILAKSNFKIERLKFMCYCETKL
ncbi:RyR domain-containing protein [Clostridium butyricum]|uniref:RyR domain-containing protein n=1 Tax=Clostridium butyricum TaxID=1492 RepID=UPI0029050477|nr:RyR domain-containing protein [Clostridium butyricum]MDU5720618.1 RyR domain-containing protein [Clostridium butyricum]MDU5818313.1 RyR domain-containing protein [Clostridium butyricum]